MGKRSVKTEVSRGKRRTEVSSGEEKDLRSEKRRTEMSCGEEKD